ncbi:hypothetical protein ACWJJH_06325 [Endozoicomonadaceae bacterium StTr2]
MPFSFASLIRCCGCCFGLRRRRDYEDLEQEIAAAEIPPLPSPLSRPFEATRTQTGPNGLPAFPQSLIEQAHQNIRSLRFGKAIVNYYRLDPDHDFLISDYLRDVERAIGGYSNFEIPPPCFIIAFTLLTASIPPDQSPYEAIPCAMFTALSVTNETDYFRRRHFILGRFTMYPAVSTLQPTSAGATSWRNICLDFAFNHSNLMMSLTSSEAGYQAAARHLRDWADDTAKQQQA